MDMILLWMINKENVDMRAYVAQHLMPRASEIEQRKGFIEMKKELAEHGHVVAQGLRRLIAAETNLIRKAKLEISRAA